MLHSLASLDWLARSPSRVLRDDVGRPGRADRPLRHFYLHSNCTAQRSHRHHIRSETNLAFDNEATQHQQRPVRRVHGPERTGVCHPLPYLGRRGGVVQGRATSRPEQERIRQNSKDVQISDCGWNPIRLGGHLLHRQIQQLGTQRPSTPCSHGIAGPPYATSICPSCRRFPRFPKISLGVDG